MALDFLEKQTSVACFTMLRQILQRFTISLFQICLSNNTPTNVPLVSCSLYKVKKYHHKT